MPLQDLPMLPKEVFGPYAILQFAAALVGFSIVVVGGLLALRGERKRKDAATAAGVAASSAGAAGPALEVYFNGPLKDIKGRQLIGRLEIKDDFAVLLSTSRNNIVDKIALLQNDINSTTMEVLRDHEAAMENRFRDIHSAIGGNLNSIHARLDIVLQQLAKIEAQQHGDRDPQRRTR
jgi:hypothetical protein